MEIKGITIKLPTGFEEQLAKRATNFDSYIRGHASGLLSAIKKEASTYGEIKEKLMQCESLIRWSNQNSHYRLVIREAKSQLEKEIDATTL